MADLDRAATIAPGKPYNPHHDRAWIAYVAWSWIKPTTPQTAAWLLQALADVEAALQLDPVDKGSSYRPNYWLGVIKPQAIDRNLERGDASLEAGDAQTALEYYELVAGHKPLDPRAAFQAGLALVILGKPEEALPWYRSGLDAATPPDGTPLAQQALLELRLHSSALNLAVGPILDLFEARGIALEAKDAATAFRLSLDALRLGDPSTAQQWSVIGLQLAKEKGDATGPRDALKALYLEVLSNPALPAGDVIDLFQSAGVSLEPDTAKLSFDLALSAVIQGDLAGAADLYNRGLELAADAADMAVVRSAAYSLRDYLLAHPAVSRTDAYWPLGDDLAARQAAEAGLAHPDLYWRYRAELGFRLLVDRQLMRQAPDDEVSYEAIMKSVASDVEIAYTQNPTEHQTMRDFYVDANIGWLYLRRGDDYAEEGNYTEALADYERAADRIQPNSQDAALDLTEDLLKAGLTALRLGQPEQATGWYDKGVALVKSLDARFGLAEKKIQPAIDDLNKLLEEQPDLAPSALPIVEQLQALLPSP